MKFVSPLDVWLIGFGKMGKILLTDLKEKNARVKVIIDPVQRQLDGKNVFYSNIQEALKKERKIPQVAVIATYSTLRDIYDQALPLLNNGINVITLSEEAFYPYRTDPKLTEKLHQTAVANNVVMVGTGLQDVFWGHGIKSMLGSMQKITELDGFFQYNIADYGKSLADLHGVGLSLTKFQQNFSSADAAQDSYLWTGSHWLVDALGWKISKQEQEFEPILNSGGEIIGMENTVKTYLANRILLRLRSIGKIYEKNEKDICFWQVKGDPGFKLDFSDLDTPALTCGILVNRLSEIFTWTPGYHTTARKYPPSYRTFVSK